MSAFPTVRTALNRLMIPLRPLLQQPWVERALEQLDDAVLLLSHPLRALRVRRAVGSARDNTAALTRVVVWLQIKLAEQDITADIYARVKRTASTYRKMRCRNVPVEEILDVRGVRIIVRDAATCYQVLALVHESFDQLPGQLDDYVAQPKENGYRSLHTVIRDAQGLTCEVQIRSRAMQRVAEQGSAAHWRYKLSQPVPGP